MVATNAQGVAQAPTLTANQKAGTFTVTASAPGDTDAKFILTNLAGAAAGIAANQGTPQSAPVNTAYLGFSALVTDAFGTPVPLGSVTFTAPAARPSGRV